MRRAAAGQHAATSAARRIAVITRMTGPVLAEQQLLCQWQCSLPKMREAMAVAPILFCSDDDLMQTSRGPASDVSSRRAQAARVRRSYA